MGFLSPWFLAGLAALGLPLWLHLLRQFKRTPQPFSSLMFFERRVQSSVRHRRLKYLLLLAMRLGLLALLALAFANPFVTRSTAVGRRRLTVIAVDRSFSMRQGTRLQDAKAEARRIVAGLGARDLAQVAALDARLEMLTGVESDKGVLNAAIDSITPTDQSSSYGELARSLRLADKNANTQIAAHFISDMQQSSLPPHGFADLQLGAGASLELHQIAHGKTPNWAVENVTVAAQIFDPKQSKLTAAVAGWQTPAAARKVTLVLNGHAVESKNVNVPANGRAEVEFIGFDVPYGANRGEVRIEPADQLSQDDSYAFAVQRSDPKRVLFLYAAGRAREGFFYKAAMAASANSGLIVEEAPLEQAGQQDFAKFAFVVLSDPGDLDVGLAKSLCGYVSKGGAVLIAAGLDTGRAGKVPLTSNPVASERVTQGVGYVDVGNAAVLGAGQFDNVQFTQSVRLQPKAGASVIARLADGSPLLVEERMGEGKVLTFAAMLDSSSSDFPLHASYLPFVVQSGAYLSGAADTPSSVVAGTPAVLRHSLSETTAADVISPAGRHELSLSDATKAMSFEMKDSGFYEVVGANGRRSLEAVHADRRESDLTPIPDETLVLWSNTGNSSPLDKSGSTQIQSSRWGLWRYVLLVGLVASLVEWLFASRYLKEERQMA